MPGHAKAIIDPSELLTKAIVFQRHEHLTGFGKGVVETRDLILGIALSEVGCILLADRVLHLVVIVGLLWGAWHFLVAFWGSGNFSGAFSLPLFLPQFLFYVGVLPAYRVLMVWVYDRTGSLLVVMLMHASLTASTVFILMPVATGVHLLIYYLVLAAALWVVVAAVAVANGGQLSRQPLPRRVA